MNKKTTAFYFTYRNTTTTSQNQMTHSSHGFTNSYRQTLWPNLQMPSVKVPSSSNEYVSVNQNSNGWQWTNWTVQLGSCITGGTLLCSQLSGHVCVCVCVWNHSFCYVAWDKCAGNNIRPSIRTCESHSLTNLSALRHIHFDSDAFGSGRSVKPSSRLINTISHPCHFRQFTRKGFVLHQIHH